MAKLIKILGAIVILGVALIVSAVAVLKSKDFNEYRGLIAEQVKAATGRELTIAGDLKLELSMQPSVVVEGVRLANASWGSKPEMASIKRFEAQVKLMPLFSGNIEVVRIVLTGVDALIEISRDGSSNLDFSGPAEKPQAATTGDRDSLLLPVIHAAEFRDIRLTYKDARSGQTQSLALDRMAVASSSLDSPVNIDLAGTINNQPITVNGAVGALQILLNGGEPWPVSLALSSPGMSLKVEGGIDRPLQAVGLDLHIALDVGDPAAVAGLAGVTIPVLPGLKVSGLLRDTKSGYSLTGVEMRAGGSDLAGRVDVALNGSRPALKAALTSKLLALDEWLVPGGPAAKSVATGDGRVFPADPMPLEGLKAVDADISLKADRLTAKRLVVGDLDVKLVLKGGLLKISPLKAALAGGRIAASLDLDSRPNPPRLALEVDSQGLNVGGMLNDMGITDILSGAMTLKTSINGGGASVRALMAGLDGQLSVVGRNGKLNSSALESMSSGVLDILPWVGKGDTNKINCIVGRFDIKGGLARSRALVLDTGGITVIGQGTLDLAEERIDMTIDTRAKNASLAKLALPINVGGSFAAPTFTPNVGKALIGVVTGTVGTVGSIVKAPASLLGSILGTDDNNAVDESDPCVQALAALSGEKPAPAQKKAAETPPPPEPKKDTGIVEGVGNLGKGLTKSLGKLFGN